RLNNSGTVMTCPHAYTKRKRASEVAAQRRPRRCSKEKYARPSQLRSPPRLTSERSFRDVAFVLAQYFPHRPQVVPPPKSSGVRTRQPLRHGLRARDFGRQSSRDDSPASSRRAGSISRSPIGVGAPRRKARGLLARRLRTLPATRRDNGARRGTAPRNDSVGDLS